MLTAPHRTRGSGFRRGIAVRLVLLPTLLAMAACGNAQPGDAPTPPPAATALACPIAIPTLSARVTDLAELMTPEQEAILSGRLDALEGKAGPQLFVVTVITLNGRTMDEFSLCHAHHWGIGREEVNDGIVLLVAPNERRVRIEVGYGLEETLTDQEAQRVLDEDVLPRFRNQDYAGGIEAGVEAIIKEIG